MQLQCTMFVQCDFVDMDVFGITPSKIVTFFIHFLGFFPTYMALLGPTSLFLHNKYQNSPTNLPLGSIHKLRLLFLAFDHVRTPPSLHFLCSKFSIFLTTYPPLNANVICEGSLTKPNLT